MRVNAQERDFVTWLDNLGNPYRNDPTLQLDLSTVQLQPHQMVPSTAELVDFCFPPEVLDAPLDHSREMLNSGILCPTNQNCFLLNNQVLARLPGENQTFLSIDKHISTDLSEIDTELSIHAADMDMENIYNMSPTGLPLHDLKLKIGAKVMLIRNLSLRDGLANGTVLQVERMTDQMLYCRKFNHDGTFEIVLLPKCKFIYNKKNSKSIKFSRIQFPVRLAFSFTIYKAQGHTLDKVGLDLSSQQVFSHGQLYVAFSRVRNADDVRVCSQHQIPDSVVNCVYRELL